MSNHRVNANYSGLRVASAYSPAQARRHAQLRERRQTKAEREAAAAQARATLLARIRELGYGVVATAGMIGKDTSVLYALNNGSSRMSMCAAQDCLAKLKDREPWKPEPEVIAARAALVAKGRASLDAGSSRLSMLCVRTGLTASVWKALLRGRAALDHAAILAATARLDKTEAAIARQRAGITIDRRSINSGRTPRDR